MRSFTPAMLIFTVTAFSGTVDFGPQTTLYASGVELDVGYVSSATFADWDGDGLKDLIAGSMMTSSSSPMSTGYLTLFPNSGTPDSPIFTYSISMQADGEIIELPGDN